MSFRLRARVAQPPAICFVDLTGYTRLIEERGDEAAAQVAGRLVALVNDISGVEEAGRSGGSGTAGCVSFREPGTAVVAGLDLVKHDPAGDIAAGPCGASTPAPSSHTTEGRRGRTVNLAARIERMHRPDRWWWTRRRRSAPRRPPFVAEPVRSGRAERRRQAPAALPGLPQVFGAPSAATGIGEAASCSPVAMGLGVEHLRSSGSGTTRVRCLPGRQQRPGRLPRPHARVQSPADRRRVPARPAAGTALSTSHTARYRCSPTPSSNNITGTFRSRWRPRKNNP